MFGVMKLAVLSAALAAALVAATESRKPPASPKADRAVSDRALDDMAKDDGGRRSEPPRPLRVIAIDRRQAILAVQARRAFG